MFLTETLTASEAVLAPHTASRTPIGLDCKDCSFAEYGRDADLNGPEYLAEQFRAGFMPAYTAIQLLGIVSDQVNRRRVRLAA